MVDEKDDELDLDLDDDELDLDDELFEDDEDSDDNDELGEDVQSDVLADEDEEIFEKTQIASKFPPAPTMPPKPTPKDAVRESIRDIASDIPVQVVAVMGKKTVTMKEIAEFKRGEVINLSRPVSEIVDLVANGKLIGQGELVDIDGKLGVRIIKLTT